MNVWPASFYAVGSVLFVVCFGVVVCRGHNLFRMGFGIPGLLRK
jgi:hypothetical protein